MTDPVVREFHASAIGIGGALAAAASAARQASADRQWAQHEQRIAGRARVNDAKRAKNQALRRRIAALDVLASK